MVLESDTWKWIWSKNGLSALQVAVEQILEADLRALELEDGGGEHR